MDELMKALAAAVQSGSAAAGPAIHSYFVFHMIENVVAYLLPCATLIVIAGLICHMVKYTVERENSR